MDILEPTLVRVEGRCYRFCDYDLWNLTKSTLTTQVHEKKPEECPVVNKEAPQATHKKRGSPDYEIKLNANGKYQLDFYIAKRYYPFIIGYEAKNIIKLQRETNTKICVPGISQECNALITGPKISCIEHAIHRIKFIIERARTKVDPTHFLSIPLNDETTKANFVKFRNAVLGDCGDDAKGVHKGIFQKPERLHLALGMLLLVDGREKQAAQETLAEWKKTIFMPIVEKNGPIQIRVEGLDCTNEDRSMVNAIYGRISSENNALQELANRTFQLFIDKGLMIPDKESPKLRVTLMSSAPSKKFCASEILTAHEDHFFGEVKLDTLYLSERGKYNANGYYVTSGKIGL